MSQDRQESEELAHPGTHNRHGVTGAYLQQPEPLAPRRFAVFDSDKPCIIHSPAYSGRVPMTGAYRCVLCGTAWDEEGNVQPYRESS